MSRTLDLKVRVEIAYHWANPSLFLIDGGKAVVQNEDNSKAIQVPTGPSIRSRAKKLKAELNGLIQAIWAQEEGTIKSVRGEKRGAQNGGWIIVIQAQLERWLLSTGHSTWLWRYRRETDSQVLESDPKLEPKEDEIGPDLEQKKAEMGVDLILKMKQEICEATKVQESSAVTDLKVNMVINMYYKYGLVGYACKVFDGMHEMVVA
ncbi:hypothetical protein LguiA_021463 [Lonicera macranthoides]